MSFLRRICYKESGKFTALDYYLSALLLEKDVNEFATTLKDLYEPADTCPVIIRKPWPFMPTAIRLMIWQGK